MLVDRYALHHNSGHSPALVAFLLTHSIRAGMLSILRAPYGLNICWKIANAVGDHEMRPFTYFSGPHCSALAAYLLIFRIPELCILGARHTG